jgi:hypothetical protein
MRTNAQVVSPVGIEPTTRGLKAPKDALLSITFPPRQRPYQRICRWLPVVTCEQKRPFCGRLVGAVWAPQSGTATVIAAGPGR